MLTIAVTPRAFHDHHALIQRNAIQSWLALRPEREIILIGNGAGIKAIADLFSITHKPDVAYSESGLPPMDSFLDIVQRWARFDRIA